MGKGFEAKDDGRKRGIREVNEGKIGWRAGMGKDFGAEIVGRKGGKTEVTEEQTEIEHSKEYGLHSKA